MKRRRAGTVDQWQNYTENMYNKTRKKCQMKRAKKKIRDTEEKGQIESLK